MSHSTTDGTKFEDRMKKIYLLLWAGFLIGPAIALPVITKQTGGTNFVSVGASITNRVSATSTNPPLSYQWKLNGAAISNAVSNSLVLAHIGLIDAGIYTVVV